jgi:hypothetical protein
MSLGSTPELSTTGGVALTPQQVFDHVKFTIEDVHSNRHRAVFTGIARGPCRTTGMLVRFFNDPAT